MRVWNKSKVRKQQTNCFVTKWEHRGDFKQEADLARGICGAHREYETAEVRDVRRIGGGHGMWMGCFLDDLRACGINAD